MSSSLQHTMERNAYQWWPHKIYLLVHFSVILSFWCPSRCHVPSKLLCYLKLYMRIRKHVIWSIVANNTWINATCRESTWLRCKVFDLITCRLFHSCNLWGRIMFLGLTGSQNPEGKAADAFAPKSLKYITYFFLCSSLHLIFIPSGAFVSTDVALTGYITWAILSFCRIS